MAYSHMIPEGQMSSLNYSSSGIQTWINGLSFSLVMSAGVIPYFFSESDQTRGISLGIAVAISFCICVLFAEGAISRLMLPRHYSLAGIIVFTCSIAYGVARAFYLENDKYYILADVYHWLIELLAITILTRVTLGGSPVEASKIAIFGCFVTAMLTSLVIVGCYMGLVQGGGYFQGNSLFWHLKVGVNYPQLPLMITVCALVFGRNLDEFWRNLAWLTIAISVVLLVMTLKRTMWLSSVISLSCVLIPSRNIKNLAIIGSMLAIAVAAYVVTRGSEAFSYLDFLSYNDAYSVTDTMEDRENQLGDAVKLFGVAGEGFGAEVDIYEVGTNRVDRIHYIHSLYVFQIVQLGLPFAIVSFSFMAALIFRLNGLVSSAFIIDWRVPAGLACLIGLGFNGVTLVSVHSAFSGVAFGLAIVAISDQPTWVGYGMDEDDEDDEYDDDSDFEESENEEEDH